MSSKQKTIRQRILETAQSHFFQFGFSKVNMDEIARDLGMSKRTLYQHFPAKKELLREALFGRFTIVSSEFDAIVERTDRSFVEKLSDVVRMLGERVPRPSPNFLRDMERFAPDVWADFDRKRVEMIHRNFTRLFDQGLKEGVLRPGLSVEFLVILLTTVVQNMARPAVLSDLPMSLGQLLDAILQVLCRGLLTEKGQASVQDLWSDSRSVQT